MIFIQAGAEEEGGGGADLENIENAISHLILGQRGGLYVFVISYIKYIQFHDDVL